MLALNHNENEPVQSDKASHMEESVLRNLQNSAYVSFHFGDTYLLSLQYESEFVR